VDVILGVIDFDRLTLHDIVIPSLTSIKAWIGRVQ
jgi:hypothetical protein